MRVYIGEKREIAGYLNTTSRKIQRNFVSLMKSCANIDIFLMKKTMFCYANAISNAMQREKLH